MPPSYVSTGKYAFSFKGAKNVSIRALDDKCQVTPTFAVTYTGDFLLIRLTYSWKIKRSLPTFSLAPSFSVTFLKNHWPNTVKYVEFFEEIIIPYLEDIKQDRIVILLTRQNSILQ